MRRCPTVLVLLIMLGAGERLLAKEIPLGEKISGSALRQKVAAAVARDLQSGPAGETAAIELLDPALSLPSSSELRVTSWRAGYSPGSWLLRINCFSRRDCLPFHVVLRSTNANLQDDLAARLTASTPGPNQASRLSAKGGPLGPAFAHNGDHVLLVEERSGMRLQVTAECLESGGLGDEIRVRNLATRRILSATVAGKGLVRVK